MPVTKNPLLTVHIHLSTPEKRFYLEVPDDLTEQDMQMIDAQMDVLRMAFNLRKERKFMAELQATFKSADRYFENETDPPKFLNVRGELADGRSVVISIPLPNEEVNSSCIEVHKQESEG